MFAPLGGNLLERIGVSRMRDFSLLGIDFLKDMKNNLVFDYYLFS